MRCRLGAEEAKSALMSSFERLSVAVEAIAETEKIWNSQREEKIAMNLISYVKKIMRKTSFVFFFFRAKLKY